MIDLTESQIMANWGVDNAETPLVSVRCITYNQEKYISDALDGFLMQKTTFPFEVVVHDDASTDKTADIIRDYEKNFPHIIKPIYETENQYSKPGNPLGKIVNAALRGKYVAYCEGDDYWIDENKLQIQVDFLEANPEYGLVFSNAIIEKNGVKTDNIIPNILKNGDVPTQQVIIEGGTFIPTPTIVVKREFIYQREKYDFWRNCWVGDYPLQIYASLVSKIYCFKKSLSVYRQNAIGSWSVNVQKRSFFKNKQGIKSEYQMLNGFNKLSNYKFNHSFMRRKTYFLLYKNFLILPLYLVGAWYNFIYLFYLIFTTCKVSVWRKLKNKIKKILKLLIHK